MKLEHLLLVVVLILLPKTEADQAVSFVKNWKEILLTDGVNNTTCTLFIDGCVRSVPYNVSKKVTKKSVNASEEETIPEKMANQNGQNQKIEEPVTGAVVRNEDAMFPLPPIPRPARNFASRECGAKIIAANPEAENAKAVVNEKDVDDYMRNPCQSAKEKFIVIELCEAIQIKKLAIGNFELFASRPKTINVFISERYPPISNWISLGYFHLQDHHKNLQTFEVPSTNIYAKYVRINLEDHYGKEHYCIVSVVNVMGSTLADEYDKEEAAAHLLKVVEKITDDLVTTPPPSEQKMQTQLPVPPKAPNQTVGREFEGFNFRRLKSICSQCTVRRVSYLFCHLLPRPSKSSKINSTPKPLPIKPPPVSDNRDLKVELKLWADRSRQMNFDQSRRRNLATIQRLSPKETMKEKDDLTSSSPNPHTPPLQNFENKVNTSTKIPNMEEVKMAPETTTQSIPSEQTKTPPKIKPESILPAGGSTNQREMVLMKLSKRIAAVEMNLTLSTEYLSELSKQYVAQMSGYQQELKETRKAGKKSAQMAEIVMRSKLNSVKRELRELRQSIYLLQQLENSRFKHVQNEMSRNIFMTSCHISSNVPPSPTLARLPLVIPAINRSFENMTNFEEKMRKIYETAKSVMLGSLSWNTDHLIVALIMFNVVSLSFLFASVFYIHRRNKERCEETQSIVRNELRARIAKVGVENRKLISKGMRKAELAVTAAVSTALKVEKSTTSKKAMTELEVALANLFAAQQTRIDEQFEENQRILRDVLAEGRRSRADDTLSVEDSESSSETEQPKDDTPTFEKD
uniref:SUN domain-containing protein n=2 Tax=Caenorhabditis tropicalis TaxID=1561998 RepID=A0A1I7TK08_9PELO